ncbi:response regulator transcription factor [Brachybacterium epidermidis]|uniref:response regulator transcription factor n=1 Tax=Brachybacterium epidermidis TaxID=2781983 RepID=UPI00398F579F
MDRRVAVVVEDDEDIRGLTVALLGQSGFVVHEAATGTAGVEAAQRHDPTVVTVDLGLPDIDGYEVTRRVRQFSDAYVVMLTARTEEIDTLLGLEAGADDYITKPFRPRELRARIDAMLRRPRTATPSPQGTLRDPAASASAAVPSAVSSASAAQAPGAPVETPALNAQPPSPAAFGAAPTGDARLEMDGLELYPELHQVLADGREVLLTPSEFLLLETLMVSGRVVRAKAALARIVRGEDADSGTFVSQAEERTVEVHLGNLRRKLADDPKAPRWVVTVRGVGYRMAGSAQRVR